MGGIITTGGPKIASALSEIAQQKSARKSYQSIVQDANKQAQALQLQQQQEQENLLRSSAEKRREQYQKFRQTQSEQQAALALAGLDGQSASVRYLVDNQKMQARLASQQADQELAKSLEEVRQKTEEQIRSLQTKAQAAQQTYRQSKNGWKLGSKFVSFLSRG